MLKYFMSKQRSNSIKVVNICNSKIGYQGNIGLRTAQILRNVIYKNNIISFSISRSILKKNKNSFTYGILKNIPSLLNAIRVNIFQNFNSKYYDVLLFELFVLFYLKFIPLHEGDVIHIWEISPRIIKYLKKKKCKIILDVPIAPHNYRNEIKNELLTKFSKVQDKKIINNETFCFNNVDKIIVPSLFVKNEIIKYNVNEYKVEIIPFGVKPDNFKKIIIEKKGIDYCLAGVLNKRKGVQYLLKAWESGNFSEDRLHLCGKLTPGISNQIKTMSNNNNIILPGFIDTAEYFKKCDVYVFPSLMEGSSKSIYEAMNRSLPIICTKESGSIIKDGIEGFIIEKMSSKDILDKLLFFKNNNDMIASMGEKSKATVSKYTWDLYAKKIINIYNNLD